MGVDPNAPLTPEQRPALIAAMGQQENGRPITPPAPAAGSGISRVVAALSNPYVDDTTKKVAATVLGNQLTPKAPISVKAGETLIDPRSYKPVYTAPDAEAARPMTPDELASYNLQPGSPYAMTPKGPKYIGSTATTVQNNFDPNGGQSYDKQLIEGLAKSHAGLSNGVEDAQARARNIAQMQGAIDAIQKGGGTTGGMAPEQVLAAKKSANAAATALGLSSPFDESGISDAEMLQKAGRQMAGEMAKSAVGSRVTNFEMQNYLAANPGLSLSPSGNQRLLGIQAQVERRNIAVGNAIRNATAQATAAGQKISPVTVQKLIETYDEHHHIADPVTGQDLTQSYALPEFQQGGTNAGLAAQHETNVSKIRRYNPQTGQLE
jgi:hypothetical protein